MLLAREQLSSVYAAKGRKPDPRGTTPTRAPNLLAWIAEFYYARDIDLLCSQTSDGYLLLRYVRLCILLCLGGCAILCPPLLSLNATGGEGLSQLDALTIANMKKGSSKTYAHACCTMIFFGWVMFVIRREMIFYLNFKHEYRVLKRKINNPNSRTVLFTDAVRENEDFDNVNQVFGDMHGIKVWFVTELRSLTKSLRQRTSLVDKLDTVLTRLQSEHFGQPEPSFETDIAKSRIPVCRSMLSAKSLGYQMKAVKRLAVKIRSLEVGEKQELHKARCQKSHACKSLDESAVGPGPPKLLSSAFVRFSSVADAEAACRSRFHPDPTSFIPQCMDTPPRDICWENLRHGWWQSLARVTLSQTVILGMIVFWSGPVAVATALTDLENIVPNSLWSGTVPSLVRNALSGLFPSLVLSMLMSLPPKIIALLARFSGVLTLGEVESYVQNYYFYFRVVQVFLVAALGSTAMSVLAHIYSDPSSATTVLATRLPGASNFYLSYFVVQGFTEAALVVLNVDGLLSRCLFSSIFDDTPRKKARRRKECFRISSGAALAICSSLIVIALCYAPTAPLTLCFATVAFVMFYLAYRHNLFFVADIAAETNGAIYYRALQHATVGIYLGELYLVGLFAVVSVDGQRVSGPLILSCLLLAGTLVFQITSQHSLQRWHDSTPWSSSEGGYALTGDKDTSLLERSHSRLCAVFLDDFKAIHEGFAASEDVVRKGEQENCGHLAPAIVEREANILLSREVDSIVRAMLGIELCSALPIKSLAPHKIVDDFERDKCRSVA